MFRSFASFNYRVWFIGALVSNIGGWLQNTAQGWVVLRELTNNNAAAMGITMALAFAPPLVLVGVTGWVADRFDRRKLMIVTQSLMILITLSIGFMLVTGHMTLPIMYAFALVSGTVMAFDNPARQAFVSDLVDRENAANAVALNAASFNVARMIGPAVAGIMVISVGSGWVFFLTALTFLALIIALACIRSTELVPRPKRGAGEGGLLGGFRYVMQRPDLAVVFVMVFFVSALGMNFPIFAATMAVDFGRDADGYGILSSILAIGSVAGALLAARRTRAMVRVIVLAAGGFGVAAAISAAMPSYWLYAICLIFTGFCVVTMLTTANGYIQTTTDPHYRGRVLALYSAILLGATPIGAPLVGWVVDAAGPRVGILVGAAGGFIAFAVGAVWMLRSGRMHRAGRFGMTVDPTISIATIPEPAPEEFSDQLAQTAPIAIIDPENPDR